MKEDTVIVSSKSDLLHLLKIFSPSSFDQIETNDSLCSIQSLVDKETWKTLFTLLREKGELHLDVCDAELAAADIEQVTSFMKLNGFAGVQVNASQI